MMRYLFIILLMLISCSKSDQKLDKKPLSLVEQIKEMSLDSTNNFGAKPSLLDVKPMSLSEAIASKSLGKAVRIKSFVTNSCSKKGCWMVVTDKENNVRVTFKDYGFFVPLGFKDEDVVLEGVLSEEEVSEDVLRHFAEDDGKSKEEVEKIKGSQMQYTFEASSVVKLAK